MGAVLMYLPCVRRRCMAARVSKPRFKQPVQRSRMLSATQGELRTFISFSSKKDSNSGSLLLDIKMTTWGYSCKTIQEITVFAYSYGPNYNVMTLYQYDDESNDQDLRVPHVLLKRPR